MSKNREAKEVHCRPAFVWIAIWLVACAVAGGTEAMAKPVIRSMELRPADPGRYDTVELLLDLEARYANPYDPDDVDVQAAFCAPSGRVLRVIGFYYIDHLRSRDLGGAAVRTRQPPTWRVRFTPDEVGTWSYRLHVRDATGEAVTEEATFTVGPSARRGFLRRSPDGLSLIYEDGTPFFGIGQNLAWWKDRPDDYDIWLPALSASGASLVRIWMASWSFGLEWNDTGLGNYDRRQDRAYQLDYVMKLAEDLGINVMLVLNNHGQLSARVNPQWHENPYNRANGGMLSRPAEFFTHAEARELFKRRLRYIVARWGHHANLLAWELWNEVDLTDDYDPEVVAAWHREMGDYLREIDPYGHLVTTSFSSPQREDAIWALPQMDLTNSHFYNVADMVEAVMANDQRKLERFAKPTLTAEYGTDWRGPARADREGVNVHNAVWAGLFSGGSATGMSWWWDSYIHPNDLYYHYKGLAGFVPLDRWLPAVPEKVTVDTDVPGDLIVSPTLGWGATPERPYWIVNPSGTSGPQAVASYLYGRRYNTDKRSEPSRFDVTLTRDGSFGVEVLVAARSGAELEIRVNGEVARWAVYPPQADDRPVNEVVRVPLVAGTYRIEVENTGADWIQIGGYVLENAVPRVRGYGLRSDRGYLLWLQDRHHTWKRVVEGYQALLMEGVKVSLAGAPAGAYRVRVWDPWTARVVHEGRPTAVDGTLRLAVPPFRRDVAIAVELE